VEEEENGEEANIYHQIHINRQQLDRQSVAMAETLWGGAENWVLPV